MKKGTTILILVFTSVFAMAQPSEMRNAYRIVGDNIVLYLKRSWPRADQEKLLKESGMSALSLDTLWEFGNLGRFEKEGWKLSGSARAYRIYKSVSSLSGDVKWTNNVFLPGEHSEEIAIQTRATFGWNQFRKPSVLRLASGSTRFFLEGNTDARDAILSGTFNGWSTSATKMTRTDSGWVADVVLKPGKHAYKFIVGGRWMTDPRNKRIDDNLVGGENSVYFFTNYEFQLSGFTTARNVFVAGTFNDWLKKEIPLIKTKTGWKLPVYFGDGPHEYKFVVDDRWMSDPKAPAGDKNSVVLIGKPYTFELAGHKEAKRVMLAGQFNGWDPNSLSMERTPDGWRLPLVLPPGNYQYKFISDNQWMTDPGNLHFGFAGGEKNSLAAIKSNYRFVLKDFPDARQVRVAGNFNDWTGYTMAHINGAWIIDVYLPPGKCLYKFIVDGKWIIDPANELWEQNKYQTRNSVMWIKQ